MRFVRCLCQTKKSSPRFFDSRPVILGTILRLCVLRREHQSKSQTVGPPGDPSPILSNFGLP